VPKGRLIFGLFLPVSCCLVRRHADSEATPPFSQLSV